MNTKVGSITILIKNRQAHSNEINRLLTENASLIIARLGVNLQRKCIEKCSAMIVIAVEGEIEKIEELEKKLKQIGVAVRLNIMTD
jgi:metal-responsive CopG/Arc/MetJ family transcriptional regulator